jgi:hypothetical protein
VKFIASQLDETPIAAQQSSRNDPLPDVSVESPTVSMKGSPHAPGNTDKVLQAGKSSPNAMGDQMRKLGSSTTANTLSIDLHGGKGTSGNRKNDPIETRFAYQEIRAAAQDAQRNAMLMACLNQ